MHRDLVEERKWISEEEYRDGLALAQLAPGPLAAQLGIYIGYIHFRILGATLCGLAFVIPSFLMVVVIGIAYKLFGGLPWMQAIFYGVGAAVITCLQVSGEVGDRSAIGAELLEVVCAELDGRGITAVEAYPERANQSWRPSPGPASIYEASGFERAAGDDRYPVYRRELTGETDADAWSGLLRASRPDDEDDDWPLPLPPKRDPDDLFRLPPAKPKRPNPFGDD